MRTNKLFVSHKHCMQVFWRDVTACWQKKILQKYWEYRPYACSHVLFHSHQLLFFFSCETCKSLSSSETNHTHEKEQKNKMGRPSRMTVIFKLLAEFVHFQNQNIRIYAKIQYARYDNEDCKTDTFIDFFLYMTSSNL